jgi:hypothetical protein
MRVALEGWRPRLAFIGEPEFELHAVSECDWAETRYFPVTEGGWAKPIAEAARWSPDFSFVFGPEGLPAHATAKLPGMKVGVVARPIFDPARAARLLDLDDFAGITYFESPVPPELSKARLLQTLPLPVDGARLPRAPKLDARRILVPQWATPGLGEFAQLKNFGGLEVLPAKLKTAALIKQLEAGGVLVYCGADRLGRADPLPILAMGCGLLVVATTEFVTDWGIEPEDDYLPREAGQLVQAVDEVLRMPELSRAVRVRGWQKVREAFEAGAAYKRLVHDVLAFADVGRLLDGFSERSGEVVTAKSARLGRLPKQGKAVGRGGR